MSKYYLMTFEDAKLFIKSGMGMFTFAMYHQFLWNQSVKINDEKNDIRHKHDMEQLENKLEKLHRKEMDELKKEFQLQIQQLHSRRWF